MTPSFGHKRGIGSRFCGTDTQTERLKCFPYSSDDVIIYIFSDPTLTVESLVGVMEKVTSDEGRRRKVWEGVLKLKYTYVTQPSYLDEVYLNYSTAEEKTHALADIYVNIRPGSSWQHLVRILYNESEMAAAKEAKPFFQQSIGGLCVKLCTYEYE